MSERIYERYAWVVLLLIELWLVVEGLLILGGLWEGPRLGTVDFDLVIGYVCFGMLAVAITFFSYRYREKWSWCAMWVLPLAFGAITANHTVGGAFCPTCAANFALSILGLILPYRLFFPRR